MVPYSQRELGAKSFGDPRQKQKRALVLDTYRYRYQQICSDISGQDIRAHRNTVQGIVRCTRNWFRASPDTRGVALPGADFIYRRFRTFCRQLPKLCAQCHLEPTDLHFLDLRTLVTAWLKVNPR